MSRVTRDDVARRAGTSSAVVSYVLNNGPRPVAPATRDRVLQAITELGYRPNLVARALRGTRSNTIGLVVPDSRTDFFTELTHAVEHAAFAAGSLVLLGNSGFSVEREHRYLESLASMQVDGLLVARAEVDRAASQVEPVSDTGVPIVYLNHRAPRGSGAASVLLANQHGGRLVTEHLLAHGYRRIGCLTGTARSGPVADRARGCSAALRSAGRSTDLVVRTDLDRHRSRSRIKEWLRHDDHPDAIVATTDGLALDVLSAAQELGLAVPGDVAVTGFGLTTATMRSWPPITTAGHPFDDFGAIAVATLHSAQQQEERLPDRILDVTLHVRSSCGCTASPTDDM